MQKNSDRSATRERHLIFDVLALEEWTLWCSVAAAVRRARSIPAILGAGPARFFMRRGVRAPFQRVFQVDWDAMLLQ